MKILIVGAGAREHALGWKLAQTGTTEIISAPGNAGLAELGRCEPIAAADAAGIAALAQRERLDLVVIGPEGPLAAGLADRLREVGVAAFGPSRAAAELESSKAFMKEFCRRNAIPTAQYAIFDDVERAKAHIRRREAPFVVKADGLAQGKGVVIAETRADAEIAIEEALSKRKFGEAGARIVIEDFLSGEEVSFFALCDGETALPLIAAQDHKRAFDGDKGPNTGGMGAYSPAPVFTTAIQAVTMEQIVLPTLRGMQAAGRPFTGILFAGLMIGADGPKLVEYNVRFGDPECQPLMRRLKSDLAPLLLAASRGDLKNAPAIEWDARACATIVYAARGYPEAPMTGSTIRGVKQANEIDGVVVFIASARRDESGALIAAGGRVLSITALGVDLKQSVDRAYRAVDTIDWPEGFFRRDIGWRALPR